MWQPVVLGRHVDSGDYVVRYAVRNKLKLKGGRGDAYAGMCGSALDGGGHQYQQRQNKHCGGLDSHHITEAHQFPHTHTHTHSNSYPLAESRIPPSSPFQAPTLSVFPPCPFHGTRAGSDALDITLLPGGGQGLGGNIYDHNSQISREVETMPTTTQNIVQGRSITPQQTNTSSFFNFAPRPVARKGSTCDEVQVMYAESGTQDEDGRHNFNGEAGHSLTQKSKPRSAFAGAGNFHVGISPGESRSEERDVDTRGNSHQTQTLKYKFKSGIGMSRPEGVVAMSEKSEKLDQEPNYSQNHGQLDVSTPRDSTRDVRIVGEALDVTVLPGRIWKGDTVAQIVSYDPYHHGPPDSHMHELWDPYVSPPWFLGNVRRSGAEGERGRLVDPESRAEHGQPVGDKRGRLTQTHTSNLAEEGVQIGRSHPDAGETIPGSREKRSIYTELHSTQKSKSRSADSGAGGFHTDVIVPESQTGHSRRQVTDSVALHGESGVRDILHVGASPKGGGKEAQNFTSHGISTPRTTHTLQYTSHSFKRISDPRNTPTSHNLELEGGTRTSESVDLQDGTTQTPLTVWNLAKHDFREVGSTSSPPRNPPSGRPDSPIGILWRPPALDRSIIRSPQLSSTCTIISCSSSRRFVVPRPFRMPLPSGTFIASPLYTPARRSYSPSSSPSPPPTHAIPPRFLTRPSTSSRQLPQTVITDHDWSREGLHTGRVGDLDGARITDLTRPDMTRTTNVNAIDTSDPRTHTRRRPFLTSPRTSFIPIPLRQGARAESVDHEQGVYVSGKHTKHRASNS
jgi:hypothetical protein